MSNITAKDIALKLGISTASVSVALNGKPGVSQTTRERILTAAEEMGYSLPKNHEEENKTICFLIYMDDTVGIVQESSFSTFVLKGVEMAAKELGYQVLVRHFVPTMSFETQTADLLENISGMLILGTDLTTRRRDAIAPLLGDWDVPFPVVIIDSFIFASYVDCVGNDNLYGTKGAISYLIDQGHRKFGYFRAKQRISNFEDRENGIRMAIHEHLGQRAEPLKVIPVDISAERAYQDILSWLQTKPELPDAFFAENDVVAAAALRAFHDCGIQVPQQVSLFGFDDIPICEMTVPTITTVHSFKERLGVEAVTRLHARITAGQTVRDAQKTGNVKIAMSTPVVERQSVRAK